MYLMYVDESGDTGLINSPSKYYVLSGVVLHELTWRSNLDQLIAFRRRMQKNFGLLLREEIHCANFINNPGALARIKRNDRLTIIRHFADELASMSGINIINVVIDKTGKKPEYDVFAMAWKALLQRFENTIKHKNFPGPKERDDTGMVFPDDTDVKKLTQLLRQMRRFNPVPNQPSFGLGYRDMHLTSIIEDPNFRESKNSYFIQAADLAAFLLYQKLSPNKYMRKGAGHNYFNRLDAVICKVVSSRRSDGIVML